MKKVTYVLIMLVAVMSIVSCSDDDDDEVGNALVGSWERQFSEDELEIFDITITFNENGRGVSSSSFGFEEEAELLSMDFTWSTSGNQLTTVTYGESLTMTYTISGNKLSFTDEDDVLTVFIRQ